ncbi:hypothetical protein [Teichococcus wenyumeiae]|uniref:hypothetical protein n=1 Tax=Teichococcus wenyumeiae TaxID=2478470 RepID=UPI0011C3AD31|nr:hypothetical protein [Pseudoroseomonas wenyumeiae]
MTQAIHLICKREASGDAKGVVVDRANHLFRSGFWDLTPAEADSLRGGWLYLHETKGTPSYIGGQILDFEQELKPELARQQRIIFLFKPKQEGREQRWRGRKHAMAWTGGPVPADLPHEV